MTDELLALTGEIVSAHVSHNRIGSADLPQLIRTTFEALRKLGAQPEPEVPAQEPAVSIRASVKPDYLVCLEDGKKLVMLKRYLRTKFGLSPQDYRAKWNLPSDYPMVAPNYKAKRSALAHSNGLGRKKADSKAHPVVPAKTVKTVIKPAKAPRKKLGIAIDS